MEILSLKNVSKTYKLEKKTNLQVLRDISFSVHQNDVIALVGPSGSGKSTCLRIVCGLIDPTRGQVWAKGEKLTGVNPYASLVFQSFALFPWLTIYQNISLALEPFELKATELRTRVKKAIDLVGLQGFEEAYPRELSGGMKQRVGIARALVMERPLLLLDEPFSALDVLTAEALRTEVQGILMDKKTLTTSCILVTHNIVEAVFMANRILLMGMNPGRIRKEIVNDLPYPRNDQSPLFSQMVHRLHELVTEVLLPDVPTVEREARRPGVAFSALETLPNVAITDVIGLLEVVSDEKGVSNIFLLAQRTGKEFGKILFVVKAAELLDMVDTPKQMVILTATGTRFVAADIRGRKQIIHELFKNLQIVQMVTGMLRIHGDLRMPIDDLKVCIQEWLPNENPIDVVEALIAWGRFAEYFGYNDDTKEFYLDVGQETA